MRQAANPSTEPIVAYSQGSILTIHSLGNLRIKEVSFSTGIDLLKINDHSIFLLNEPAITYDTWEGQRLPERQWRAGDIQFLPADSSLKCEAASPYSETLIRIPDALLRQATRLDIDYSQLDLRYRDLETAPMNDIAGAIRMLASSIEPSYTPLMIESLAIALAANVVYSLSSKAMKMIAAKKNGLSRERKRRVVEYIEANLANVMPLSDIAGVAAMSPYHFCRSFKTSFGISPIRYVWERRVEAVKQRMRRDPAPLSMIALECGFASQAHLTTAFKRVTGTTPAVYRRSLS